MNKNSQLQSVHYAVKLAILYGAVWFIDLLDASLLNVALPKISQYFRINPTNAEWVLIGFLLAMTIGMILSDPCGKWFGKRKTFLIAQWGYIISSIGCGISSYFSELVFFRIAQGFFGGLAIPIGMTLVMTHMPQNKWAKTGSWMNLFTLLAPALGPIVAGYIICTLSWEWLFFIKLPISIACVLLSHIWIRPTSIETKSRFDWLGFLFIAISLSVLLLTLSEIGKPTFPIWMFICFSLLIIVFGIAFYWQQKRAQDPLIPLKIFSFPLFSWGNIIQSAANMIFLGATFLIALYLQRGLGFSIIKTGWLMSIITLGMASMMPLTGKFYNKLGPLPFIIPGLIVMSISMFAFTQITAQSPFWVIAIIIFFEGAGSAALQTTNFVSIFSEIPSEFKGAGSALYSLFKQISASFGIALSTMMLTLQLGTTTSNDASIMIDKAAFYPSFILLGLIPLLALFCCRKIDNKKALQGIKKIDHLETEFEEGAE